MSKGLRRWSAAGLLAAGGLAVAAYLRDINRAYRRVRGKSSIIPSPYGDIEYTEGGSGTPVLVSHGSGGGYDQGTLIAQALLDNRFHWIAPSRFGYLRSTFHKGATFDDQAHAYAALLDHLGFERVAVIALSHGGPAALLFAVLYPERVSSLTLISAGVATIASEDQQQANQKGSALVMLYKYDWLYWAMTKLFKKQFISLMGAPQTIVTELTRTQKELVDRIIDEMNPVSLRSAGALFDNRATLPGDRIAAIQAPTLIFHSTDDTLQRFHNAEFAAATIPDARLVRFKTGGHLVMAIEHPTIRAGVQKHILAHSSQTAET
ncbi:MAG: alpha/beta hydrolase [Anaerolineae bacterium]|nr:alpha/beta hydrolase [Anaerolineae bacterium]